MRMLYSLGLTFSHLNVKQADLTHSASTDLYITMSVKPHEHLFKYWYSCLPNMIIFKGCNFHIIAANNNPCMYQIFEDHCL